tara:strand:- start:177154 stop:179835 length:2682 start_codon:yes stop_codon:yes gene_type:complete
MHEIGVSVIWLSLQVTIVAVASALLYWLLHRRGPLLRSLVISSSLLVTLLLAALLFSPWPRWGSEKTRQGIEDETQGIATADEKAATFKMDSPTLETDATEFESLWKSAWGGFVEGLKKPQSATNHVEPFTWPAIIGFLFLGGISLGLLRLCVGYVLLKREVQHSTALGGTAAQELLDGLLLEQNSALSVHLRETKQLATAAVVGWWRPVILLPQNWRTWSADQLRAVLTHELSHIHRQDFLSNLYAEISRSIYFYHPLMHWLVARLRLEQELAADAAAAQSSGGAESYLVILAEMAMAQSNRSVPGPARAFLPTQSTFLRRIDMLKDKSPLRGTVSRSARVTAILAVMLVGMVAVGIRGDRVSIAQDALSAANKSNDTKTEPEKFRIDFVPENALAVIALRPAQILTQDSMKPIRNLLKQDEIKNSKDAEIFGLKLKEIETAVVIILAPEAPVSSLEFSALVLHTNKVIDREAAVEIKGGTIQVTQYKGQTYLKNTSGPHPEIRLFLDDHTLLYTSREQDMHTMIDAMQKGGTRRWAKQWQSVMNDSVAGMIDMRVARAMVGDEPARLAAGNAPVLGMISPIWENTDVVSFGLTINQNLSLNATLSQTQNGGSVKATLDAVLTLARNMLSQMKQNQTGANVQERLALMSLVGVAEQAMDSTRVTQKGEDVTLAAALPDDSDAQMVALLAPAIMQAREATRRAESMNNLKQIILALHNYYDVHKHFPPAVVIGPDGKTPHSWRVAILPYLDQQALYDQYHLDEPWNSQHNLKIAKTLVPAFHNPNDDKPANASYFVVVGKNTAFGAKAGITFQEVTDGLSNTIAVVEAKRDIPWTKPEDIPYDGKTLPKLGGFFPSGYNVGFCDGAVRFISENLDQKTLIILLIINDGKHVEF